jgi:hypothetical protein
MPHHEAITSAAAAIAQRWWALAVVWHVFFGAVVLAAVKWNMSQRTLGWLLAAPLASVSAIARAAGNPFNGALFGLLSITLAMLAARFPHERSRFASRPVLSAGLMLLAFGWVYPHFLDTSHWLTYGVAAPLGLLPCPTLAAVTGVGLMLGLYRLRSWTGTVAAAAAVYGAMGVFWLAVSLDVALLAGAAVLWIVHVNATRRSVRAVNGEQPSAVDAAQRPRRARAA